jgi:hypothetical protein
MIQALGFTVIHERNSDLASLILDRINRIDMVIVVLLSFPDGRTKIQCRQRRQEKAPRSSQRLVLWHSTENAETSFYLSRVAGFLPREMCNLFHWGVFLSFFRKLRKRKENPIDPANPVR